jgi:beta-lactamase regulating signal transducer with metallopeptidase domain
MDYLLQAAVRSVVLATVAGLGLWRVKSASIRHAVWTLVTAGMLVQIALSPLLQEIPLRVLGSAEPAVIVVTGQVSSVVEESSTPQSTFSWEQLAAGVYFCGFLFFAVRLGIALAFARRLVRTSAPAGQGTDHLYQSQRIAAPVTIGRRILLPAGWRDWDSAKLRSVLAHEESHVRRWDWAIAAMARVNRCVFWFHPLAWWLERRLARLAEQACDDAALAVVEDRQEYARTLLDIARTIQYSKGRVLAVPMAKEANVETRINRILDETRRIPKALGRRGWIALGIFAVPLIYTATTVQLAPAQTTVVTVPQPQAPSAPPLTTAPPVAQTPAPPAMASPAPPRPPAPETPPPAQAQRPRDIPGSVGGPISIPKIYNGHDKTFFFFNYDEYQNQLKQLQDDSAAATLPLPAPGSRLAQFPASRSDQAPAPSPATTAADEALLHVDVTSVRMTRISIPLDASGEFELTGRITTLERKFVSSFDELVNHRESIEREIPLKAGTYTLSIVVKNLKDGMQSRRILTFDVE